jgi:Bacterial SH3 domain
MSFVRIAASAAIVMLVSAVGATAKPVTTTTDTNLRKSAGTDSPVLTLIPRGTTVEVGKCSNGWCQASLNGQDGYVIAQNVGMATARRAPRRPEVFDEEVEDDGPPLAYGAPYVVDPPVYYGYGPYYGYGGWGYRGWGWGRRW